MDSSLLDACYENNMELIKEKLKTVKPSQLKESSIEKGTPLQAAAINENKEAIDLLLQAGANIDQGNFLKNSALLTCVEKGKLDMAKYLLEKGADVNKKGCQNRNSLSQHILYSWNLPFANYLLKKGCLINTTSQDKISLLSDAASKNSIEAVEFLFENGIDKSYINSALCWAIIYNSSQAVQLFLEMGANLDEMYAGCKGIEKALYHNCLAMDNRGSKDELIRLLIGAGIDFKQIPQRAISVGIEKTKLSPYDYALEYVNKYPGISDFVNHNIKLVDELTKK